MQIIKVIIYIDDNMPEYMDGIVRVGDVIVQFKDETEKSMQELIDNTEYHTERELVEDISSKLGVSKDIIEVYY